MWDREQTILEYSQNFEKPYSYEDINDMAVNRDRQRKRSGNKLSKHLLLLYQRHEKRHMKTYGINEFLLWD